MNISAIKRITERQEMAKYVLALIVIMGLAARLLAWTMLPDGEFGGRGDEISYYRSGIRILLLGTQNLFWPPLTGWLVAGLGLLFQTESIWKFRFIWCFLDTANLIMLWFFARRIQKIEVTPDRRLPLSFVYGVTLVYALYLPAIGYAVHVTSEVPALFLLLACLLILGIPKPATYIQAAVGGLFMGLCILTRPNLAPLLLTLTSVIILLRRSYSYPSAWKVVIALFLLCSLLPPAAWVARNYLMTGRIFLSLNLVSNASVSAESPYINVDLVNSTVTEIQVSRRDEIQDYQDVLSSVIARAEEASSRKERRRILRDELPYQNYDIEEFFTSKPIPMEGIFDSPIAHLWIMAGRLARVVMPQTNVLDFFSAKRSLLDPWKLSIFLIANLQWGAILIGGIAGLLSLRATEISTRLTLGAVVFGCLAASPLSVSEPRYAFPFTFALIMALLAFLTHRKANLKELMHNPKIALLCLACWAFVVWGWISAALWALNPALRAWW